MPTLSMHKLSVVYQDRECIAVYKPAGIPVHRSALHGERHVVLQWLRDQIGQRVYPVHRLDRGTAGLLLFALNPGAARALARQFELREARKTYLAMVRGYLPEQGRIDYALAEAGGVARSAVTDYTCLATAELDMAVRPYATTRYSLAKLSPRSGRRHQIRRHLAHLRHPVIGDSTHGDNHHNRAFRDRFGDYRLMLVAVGLSLRHPAENRLLHLKAAPDAGFARVCESLGWPGDPLQTGSSATDP